VSDGGFADGSADGNDADGRQDGRLRRRARSFGAGVGMRDQDPDGTDGVSGGSAPSGSGQVPGQGTAERGAAERGAPETGGESAARRIALDALSRAARTRGQLEALLQRKEVAPEAAAAVLDRFEEAGLIDDRGYAEAFVESRHRVRGQGSRALSVELRRRGVADDVVAEAVGGLDPDREFETACRIARSRYERMPAVAPEVKVRRLAGYLARKGYSGAVVARVVRQVVESAESLDVAVEAAEVLDGMGGMGEDPIMDDGDGDGDV
jgi:regulatory protein